jgi:hypothetical protein
MTASPPQEVDGNLLHGAALGSTQTRSNTQDAGGQHLGDLVEALAGSHQMRRQRIRHHPLALPSSRKA